METVDYNHDDFTGRYAADKAIMARFYIEPVQDRRASAKEGRPIFEDTEFVEIIAAGNKNNIVRRAATDDDRARFARQYAKFLEGHKEQHVGTPLKETPWLTRSQVEELAHLSIHTLESLANLDDAACARYTGLFDLKRKAGASLEQAKGIAPATALLEENEKLKNQVAALSEQVKKLAAEVKAASK